MPVKPFSQWMDEDAPANAAGLGGIAGIGVGPHGEPGIDLRKMKKRLADGQLTEVNAPFPVEDPNAVDIQSFKQQPPPAANPLKDHYAGIIRSLQLELGRTRFALTRRPTSRTLMKTEKSLHRKITRQQNLIAQTLKEGYESEIERAIRNGASGSPDYVIKTTSAEAPRVLQQVKDTLMKKYGWINCGWEPADSGNMDTGIGVQYDYEEPRGGSGMIRVHRTKDGIAVGGWTDDSKRVYESVEPISTFAGADVFEVTTDKFLASRNGKNRYHRWSRYVGEDETGEAIRQHGKNTKKDIVLQDSATRAMIYLRRKHPK